MSEWKDRWENTTLNEVCDLIPGFAFKSKDFGDYPTKAIKIGDIHPPRINTDTLVGVNLEAYNITKLEKFKVLKGDFILAMTGATIGKIGRYNDEALAYINQRTLRFCVNDSTDSQFIYYVVNTNYFRDFIFSHVDNLTAQPNISAGTVATYTFQLPPLEVQQRISAVLTVLDEKIELNRRLNDNLESMAQALYDYWFVQFDFPDENGKPYKSSGGKMVWNEVLKREIPEGWTTETVGEITMCHDSRRIPLSGKERESMQGDIPYYGATGIFGYVNRHIFDGDFVLLAEDGSVMNDKGRPIVQRVSGKVWINNHAHVLQPIKEHGCKLLMMILSEIPVEKIKTGSIQAKINQANLNAYNLVKIPRFLISRMNKILDEIDSRILAIAREISTLTKQRDFLLPLLMNGQVQVKPQRVNYHLSAD